MTKIVLLCAAGMSTSALVRKMKDAAKAEDYECDISAHSVSEAKNYQSADMILLGPQVRYRLKEVQGELPNNKVEVIDMKARTGAAVWPPALSRAAHQHLCGPAID